MAKYGKRPKEIWNMEDGVWVTWYLVKLEVEGTTHKFFELKEVTNHPQSQRLSETQTTTVQS